MHEFQQLGLENLLCLKSVKKKCNRCGFFLGLCPVPRISCSFTSPGSDTVITVKAGEILRRVVV